MGRPINANAAETRADLLRVAIEHFGRDGFRRATTRRIAEEVGVSFATVHHYFGTKEALYAECIAAAFTQLLEVGAEVASILVTPPEESRVARAVRHGFRALSANQSRSRFLLRAFVFEDPELVAKNVPAHRTQLLEGALSLLGVGGDEAAAEARNVRLIGLGMLITRFVAASDFERDILGDSAFAASGAIEDYLVFVAESTIGADVGKLSALAAFIPSAKDSA
jgi:AcrR family transcriptional regulator